MSDKDLLSTVPGFYILTEDGELGYFEQGRWRLDVHFTSIFLQHNRSLLAAYLKERQDTGLDAHAVRIGVIGCPPDGGQKWGSRTLIFETAVVTNLYRVHGSRADELTEFQKRCRQQSIYRGMELLLEYRRDELQGVPIYCPVLFDRGTTLDRYAALLDRPPLPADAQTPVVEVLNLLAPIPVTLRHHPVLLQLIERIHGKIVDKNVRKSPALSLLAAPFQPDAVSPQELFRSARFISEAEDEALAPASANEEAPITATATEEAVGDAEIRARAMRVAAGVGIEKIASQVTPEVLKKFDRLRRLDDSRLAHLARRCRVYTASPGTLILKRGARDKGTLFLLDGELVLKAADKGKHVIDSGSRQARAPIAQLKPRMYSVRAHTRATFLWVQDACVEEASGLRPPAGHAVASHYRPHAANRD